ncbi:MAG: DHHA1 domain-containing protein, partial [Planctomycetota bacterium]
RRIEAYTSLGALEFMRRMKAMVEEAGAALKVPVAQVPARLDKLLQRERELTREVESLKRKLASGTTGGTEEITEHGGIKVATAECPVADLDTMGEQIDRLRDKVGSGIAFVGAKDEGKVLLAVGVTKDLLKRFRAGTLIKEAAKVVGGGGGGRPDFARGQGKRPDKLGEAFTRLREIVEAAK